MNFILSFLGTLSVVSVVLTALWFLIPKGTAENTFKYAMGVFVIWIVISTFNISALNPPKEIPAVNTNSVIDRAQSLSEETAEYIIEDLLNRCNIKFKEVGIIMDNSDSSDISITKVRVDFLNKEDFNLAYEIIKKQTGIVLVR